MNLRIEAKLPNNIRRRQDAEFLDVRFHARAVRDHATPERTICSITSVRTELAWPGRS